MFKWLTSYIASELMSDIQQTETQLESHLKAKEYHAAMAIMLASRLSRLKKKESKLPKSNQTLDSGL